MFMKFRPRVCKYGSRAVYPCHRFSYLHSSVSTVSNCTWLCVYRSMSELRICVKLGKKLYSDASSIRTLHYKTGHRELNSQRTSVKVRGGPLAERKQQLIVKQNVIIELTVGQIVTTFTSS